MKQRERNTLLACAIAVAGNSSAVSAGGPVGTIPFDGDGTGSGFTIDNPAFDFSDVANAPCPTGAVCTNAVATADDEILMREVDAGGSRYIQMIFVEPDDVNGDFTYEATVSSGGGPNAIGAKTVIDEPVTTDFYSEQEVYRGALFGASSVDDNLAVNVFESVGVEGGLQTFEMETTQVPDEGASLLRNGRIHIYQSKAAEDTELTFGHTILTGSYQTSSGTLSVGGESFTFAAGDALSATWYREILFDEVNGDIDFGALIYRGNNGPSIGSGNAGGTPTGLLDPQFSQDPTDYEASGISQVIIEDGTSFEAADQLLEDNWDEGVFGPNPYETQ